MFSKNTNLSFYKYVFVFMTCYWWNWLCLADDLQNGNNSFDLYLNIFCNCQTLYNIIPTLFNTLTVFKKYII